MKKSSPGPLKKLYKKKLKCSRSNFSKLCMGKGSTLFRRDFACGEIGYRKLLGPLPLSLHNIRIALTNLEVFACRS